MLKTNLGANDHMVTDGEFKRMGRETEGYSGSDLSILVRDALMAPIRKVQSATHFKKVTLLLLLLLLLLFYCLLDCRSASNQSRSRAK